MQLSQLTLEPHNSCYTCWVQVVYSHLHSLLFCSLGISSTAAQYQVTWRTTLADLMISRRCLPTDVPMAPWSSCIYLHFRIPWTDSWFSCNKEFIYNLYAFITWYVLWYLDNSVVYMRDLILAHIWLPGLCPCKSGVTVGHPSAICLPTTRPL
jgi:hypothetical protein